MRTGPEARTSYTAKRLQDAARGLKAGARLRRHDAWSREELVAHQHERAREVIRHAAARSRLYAERLDGATELRDIEPVTKTELMARFDDWVTDPRITLAGADEHLVALTRDAYLHGEYRALATGGTTGRRGIFVFDRAEWIQLLGIIQRATQACGLRPRMPRMRFAFVGAPSALHMTRRVSDTMNVGAFKRLGLAATQPIADLADVLERFKPDVLAGYPSVVAMLAGEGLDIAPSVVITSSEVLTPEMRERIRGAWGVEPHEIYGATDGLWGSTCEHHNLHFAEDVTIVEVEDERLLITNLFMRTQPIIRYEITDIVRIDETPCPCGRPYRTVKAIEGRSDDILRLGGVSVHPIALRSPLAKVAALRAYQIVHRADGLHVRAVPRDGADVRAPVHAALTGALAAAGASGTPVHVDVVAELERDAGAVGKLKLVRSEVG
jgi:phenylacetate-CoA ligase